MAKPDEVEQPRGDLPDFDLGGGDDGDVCCTLMGIAPFLASAIMAATRSFVSGISRNCMKSSSILACRVTFGDESFPHSNERKAMSATFALCNLTAEDSVIP
jgi:hypothetical protein